MLMRGNGSSLFSFLSGRTLYILIGVVYANVIYSVYPYLHSLRALHAFRLTSHDASHFGIGLWSSLFVIFASSLVSHPTYRIFNSTFVFLVYVPALMLFPFFDPGLATDGTTILIVSSSLIVSIIGFALSKKISALDLIRQAPATSALLLARYQLLILLSYS